MLPMFHHNIYKDCMSNNTYIVLMNKAQVTYFQVAGQDFTFLRDYSYRPIVRHNKGDISL